MGCHAFGQGKIVATQHVDVLVQQGREPGHVARFWGFFRGLVLWNTRYLQQALEEHQATEEAPEPDDVARLSPLLHEHINMLGR
ncbi:MAG: hypothetical protein EOO60_07975, partial [Hymenobacter sp.]